MDQNKVAKFFRNTCTPAEVEEVLQWFRTPEGQAFLKKKLDQDTRLLQDERIKPLVAEIRSEKMWDAIEAGVEPSRKLNYRPHRRSASYWQAAAVLLILLVSSVFYVWNQVPVQEGAHPSEPALYAAGGDQQKALTLSDGTRIRLNSNAQIWIPEDYGRSAREVTLEGEAYFEVVHNGQKPFLIHTAGASIKDLGTAFNVRSIPGEQNIQVAVTEGKVSVWSDRQTEEEATELTPGQFGYLDLKQRTMQVDQFGVHNYLSWMNGRLQFDRAPLDKVSMQLSRIYGVSFGYADDALRQRLLTTDFARGSLEKVLEVISLTLRIDYRTDGNKVMWLRLEQDSTKKINVNK